MKKIGLILLMGGTLSFVVHHFCTREHQSEQITTIAPDQISHREAARLVSMTLSIVHERLQADSSPFRVVYCGQPHLQKEEVFEKVPEDLNPMQPIALALAGPQDSLEPIDILDVLEFTGYEKGIGRTTSGLKTAESLSVEILKKIEVHIAAKKDPKVLISSKGVKYDTRELGEKYRLFIGPEFDGLSLNGHRIVYFNKQKEPSVISASRLRGEGLLKIKEGLGPHCIYIEDPMAPQFYIDTSQTVRIHPDELPENQREEAKHYSGNYLVLQREQG